MNDTNASERDELRQAQEMVREIVLHHFGSEAQQIEHQSAGLSNYVFLVKHAEGDFVVRICPEIEKLRSYIKEQWATAKVREAGVPATEILEVGSDIVKRPYMVTKKVSGMPATGHVDRCGILHELGRYAARINSIPTNGFGSTFDWSGNQLSLNRDWKSYLEHEYKLDERIEILAKHSILPAERLDKVRAVVESMANLTQQPALNHGDLRLKNVIVDEAGKITAILDWEECTSNFAPHWELSLALHDLSIDEKEHFLSGYGITAKDIAEFAPVLKALNVLNYTSKIKEAADSNDPVKLTSYRLRLSGALDLYCI